MQSHILAWDTSRNTGILSAYAVDQVGFEPQILHSALLEVDQKQHSEGLFLGIEAALGACGWAWADVTAIGIGVGPGSFTGVRVGMTAARTFGQMLGIPLIPVSSLAITARVASLAWPEDQGHVLLREACMGEVYIRSGKIEAVVKLVDLGSFLDSRGLESAGLTVLADQKLWAHPVLKELLRTRAWIQRQEKDLSQDAPVWARAVAAECAAGVPVPALEASPVYLRAPDAELNLKAKLASLG